MYAETRNVLWGCEDHLEVDITPGMYRASEIIGGVRMYPFVMVDCAIYYLEK